jgi:glucosylceramidase
MARHFLASFPQTFKWMSLPLLGTLLLTGQAHAQNLTQLQALLQVQVQAPNIGAQPPRCSGSHSSKPISGIATPGDHPENTHAISFPADPSLGASLSYVDAGDSAPSCQSVRGYGFALTEATTMNYEKLTSDQKQQVMQTLFSKKSGAGFSYLVLPVSSNDFGDPNAPDHSICDCHGRNPDKGQSCFDPSSLETPLRFLQQAAHYNPGLKVMLKPWSPPPYMKTSQSGNVGYRGGDFDIEWSDSLAGCLSDAVDWLSNRGVKVQSVSTQNEPGLKLPYPSVHMDEVSQAKVLDGLFRNLSSKYPDLQYVLRADNFNSSPSAKATLDSMKSGAKNLVFAAHCYGGTPSDTDVLMSPGYGAFCQKDERMEYMLGECTGHDAVNTHDFQWWIENRLLLDAWMGATGTVAWNGVLDEQNGPKRGGCSKCRGLLTTDFSSGSAVMSWNPEYYALSQVSHFVQDGAKRIVKERQNAAGVSQIFYENPDGKRVAIFWNPSQQDKSFRLVTQDCSESTIHVAAYSAVTVTW